MRKTPAGSHSDRRHIRSRIPDTVLCGRYSHGLSVVDDFRKGDEPGLCRACYRAVKRTPEYRLLDEILRVTSK